MSEMQPPSYINGGQCPHVTFVLAAVRARYGWTPTEGLPQPQACDFVGIDGTCQNTHSIELVSSAPGEPAYFKALTRDTEGNVTEACARDDSAYGVFGPDAVLEGLTAGHRLRYPEGRAPDWAGDIEN